MLCIYTATILELVQARRWTWTMDINEPYSLFVVKIHNMNSQSLHDLLLNNTRTPNALDCPPYKIHSQTTKSFIKLQITKKTGKFNKNAVCSNSRQSFNGPHFLQGYSLIIYLKIRMGAGWGLATCKLWTKFRILIDIVLSSSGKSFYGKRETFDQDWLLNYYNLQPIMSTFI